MSLEEVWKPDFGLVGKEFFCWDGEDLCERVSGCVLNEGWSKGSTYGRFLPG